MGNVASRLDDAGSLFSKDQNRCMLTALFLSLSLFQNERPRANELFHTVSVASVTISNSRRRLLTLSPNAFPAVRYIAKRDPSDETPIEYIQV